jgi:hypothetical protein
MFSASTMSVSCQACALVRKLRLVDEHAMQWPVARDVLPRQLQQVVGTRERDAARLQPDA